MSEPDDSDLERIAREVAGEWGLELGPAFQLSNFSYVASVGSDAVLKIGWQDDDESVHEADALELWAGDGAIRNLRADRTKRALLLERARPGTDLAAMDSAAATTIAVGAASRLWRPAAPPFRWIGDYVNESLTNATPQTPAARRLLQSGREVFDQMQIDNSTLIHGDLHHHNILDAGTRYLAIDPKPMLGEPEFDVPPFLWNPLGSEMNQRETERRLDAFAEAGLDQTRMRAWTLVRGAYQCVGDWLGDPIVKIIEAIQPH